RCADLSCPPSTAPSISRLEPFTRLWLSLKNGQPPPRVLASRLASQDLNGLACWKAPLTSHSCQDTAGGRRGQGSPEATSAANLPLTLPPARGIPIDLIPNERSRSLLSKPRVASADRNRPQQICSFFTFVHDTCTLNTSEQ